MQSGINEHVQFTNSEQHSINNNIDKNTIQTVYMDDNISEMVQLSNKEEQTQNTGYTDNTLFTIQTSKTDHAKNKLNFEQKLDEIEFSDEEDLHNNLNQIASNNLKYEQEKELLNNYYFNDEDSESMNKYTGTKNEKTRLDEIPVPFDLNENDVLIEAGSVEAIVEEDKIMLKALNLEKGILDLDNILFNANRQPIGYLDDVIGKIDSPVYVIIFFPNIIDKSIIKVNQTLFSVLKKAKIINPNINYKKGCDASNAFDEEINEDDIECSDDEEEQLRKKKFKANKKQKTEITSQPNNTNVPSYLSNAVNNLNNKYIQNNKTYQNEPNYFYTNNVNNNNNLNINNNTNNNQTNSNIQFNNQQQPQNVYNPFFNTPYSFASANNNNNLLNNIQNIQNIQNMQNMQNQIYNQMLNNNNNNNIFNPLMQNRSLNFLGQQINPFEQPQLNNNLNINNNSNNNLNNSNFNNFK